MAAYERGIHGSCGGFAEKAEGLRRRGYLCHEKLGKGAFSEAYRVEDAGGRMYACKISGNATLLEREAEVMKKAGHPLFPQCFRFWTRGGLGYLIMEYVPGSSLETMLRRRGGFSPRQVTRAGMELAEGLLRLHESQGRYLFRDVKPANVMVRQDGRIKLLDFGCVCSMGEKRDSCAGTPGFGAPEQFEAGRILTEACDVYGLGRTLEEMLRKGEPPGKNGKRGGRKEEIRRKDLEELLKACTAREPEKRIPDMGVLMAGLGELQEGVRNVWRREVSCRKNLWAGAYKRS